MEKLRKEYLKMNRLTQKIVDHFLQSIDETKFNNFILFLVRVIFGEHIDKKIKLDQVSGRFRVKAIEFKDFVQKHLRAAEELISRGKSPLKKAGRHKKVINNRLGNLLFPPERAIKFDSILNDSKKTQITRVSAQKERMLDSVLEKNEDLANGSTKIKFRRMTLNKTENEHYIEPQNALIIPTVRNVSHLSPELDRPDKARDPNWGMMQKRVDYLRFQINYYEKRIEQFYYSLRMYAQHKQEARLMQKNRRSLNLKRADEPLVARENVENLGGEILRKRSFFEEKPTLPSFSKVSNLFK